VCGQLDLGTLISLGFIWVVFVILSGFHAALFFFKGFTIGARGRETGELVLEAPSIVLPLFCFLTSLLTFGAKGFVLPWFVKACCESYGLGDLAYAVGVGTLITPQWRRAFHFHFTGEGEAFIVIAYVFMTLFFAEFAIPLLDLAFGSITLFAFYRGRRTLRD
jgi:hypothetical protein